MVVLRFSVGNREMRRTPEMPPLSLAQLSDLPTPSEVTTPMPVTATIGLPALSKYLAPDAVAALDWVIACPSIRAFDETEAFAAPGADARHHDLAQRMRTVAAIAAAGRRKQLALFERHGAKGEIGRKLRLGPVPRIRASAAHGKAEFVERPPLRAGCRLDPGGAGDGRRMSAVDAPGEPMPLPLQYGLDAAFGSPITVRSDCGEPRPRPRSARARVVRTFQHQ